MRPFLKSLGVVALLVVPVALLSSLANAAETWRGTVIVTDAGLSSNLLPMDGGAFYIPPLSLVTVQPNAAAYVCVDAYTSTSAPTCSATLGVKVAADTAFPSSCKKARNVLMADGGIVIGCTVTIKPVSTAACSASVWTREEDGAKPEF